MTTIDIDIKHYPDFIVDQVEKHYSEKDGVPVKYVLTSALKNDTVPVDIYYRETPHPEFGNRYFGLYVNPFNGSVMICNADFIEELDVAMVQDKDGQWVYSQHRHHMQPFTYIDSDGNEEQGAIDGGRTYTRMLGQKNYSTFKVKDGAFIEVA